MQATEMVGSDGRLAYEHYLAIDDVVRTSVSYQNTPVYETVTIQTPSSPARFIKLEELKGSVLLPTGAVPVFGPPATRSGTGEVGQSELIGYHVPADAGSTREESRLTRWQSTAVEHVEIVPHDVATQTVVTGSEDNDIIVPGTWTNGLPALFRGTVSTGAGDDQVLMANGGNLPNDRAWTRFDEWQTLLPPLPSLLPDSSYARGLGAWIDLGTGDDIAHGTDGDDFIIGGAGNDFLDGQAGSDAYHVNFQPGEVDHISDLAYRLFEVGPFGDIPVYFAASNADTVEFDASVQRSSLSYRWVRSAGVCGELAVAALASAGVVGCGSSAQ
jgi:hypothetical protein